MHAQQKEVRKCNMLNSWHVNFLWGTTITTLRVGWKTVVIRGVHLLLDLEGLQYLTLWSWNVRPTIDRAGYIYMLRLVERVNLSHTPAVFVWVVWHWLQHMVEGIEKAALLIAAAIHDLDHMGRTSSFLVSAEHPLALLYNDMSVSVQLMSPLFLSFHSTAVHSTVNEWVSGWV